MDTQQAVAILRDLTPRPGYLHRVEDYSNRFEHHVAIRIIQKNAHRSEREHFPAYRECTNIWADFAFDVGEVTTLAELANILVHAYLLHEAHEIREFIRTLKGEAPLHPHTCEGMAEWARLNGTNPQDDLSYGFRKLTEEVVV